MKYLDLVKKVMDSGEDELNARTQVRTRRCMALTVTCPMHSLVFSPRKMSVKIAAAEVAWLVSGTTSTAFLSQYTKIWEKFEEPKGVLATAYGNRWRKQFGRDQLLEAINLLKKDKSSRQCLVMSWDPRVDGLMNQGNVKNVPCPFAFSLYIVAGEGRMVVYQRSADVIVGIPYDLLSYMLLGQAIFNSVGVEFWGISIMIGDAHIYEPHWEVAKRMIKCGEPDHPLNLYHAYSVDDLLLFPHGFVDVMADKFKEVDFKIKDQLEAVQ